jgi:hypothetical protein
MIQIETDVDPIYNEDDGLYDDSGYEILLWVEDDEIQINVSADK